MEFSATGAGATGDSLEWEVPGERRHGFSGRLREEESAPAHRVLDARKVPVGDVLAGASDSLRGTRGQERLWLDRQPVRDLGVDR